MSLALYVCLFLKLQCLYALRSSAFANRRSIWTTCDLVPSLNLVPSNCPVVEFQFVQSSDATKQVARVTFASNKTAFRIRNVMERDYVTDIIYVYDCYHRIINIFFSESISDEMRGPFIGYNTQ